jgi:outer membrane protein
MTIKITSLTRTATVCLFSLFASPLCHAEMRPLWEAGAGIAAISLPDYRGSNQTSNYLLPVPYIVYRGEHLKADRDGVRTAFFDSDRVELSFSLNGSLPVNSRDNDARRGMADLKPTVEVGPTANINLWKSAGEKYKLDLRTPIRTAITIESSPKQIGWLFTPNLNLDIKDPAGFGGWNLGLLTGVIYSSQKYNDYFYSVSPANATSDRPSYTAPGGFAGTQFVMATSKRFSHYWVGAFLRYDTLAGAVFDDSPLVKKRNGLSAGFAISWVFDQSSHLVESDDN